MSRHVYVYKTMYMQRGEREGGGGGALRWRTKFAFCKCTDMYNNLTLADKLKPIRAAVFFVEEFFAVGELPCLTSFAFRRIRAVEIGNMLVAYVAEPNYTQMIGISSYLVLLREEKNSCERKKFKNEPMDFTCVFE